ncbi:hypothetical protein UlMin_034917 [Ulmus minor]
MDFDYSKLFGGGISRDTSENTLKEHFDNYGSVISCLISKDRTTGNPRGFGFVTFSDSASADEALKNNHVILGRTVEVKRAKPRDPIRSQQQSNLGLNINENNHNLAYSSRKIFVGGLPADLKEEEFKNYFEGFGRITDVVVMHDNETNRPRGFGFITFDSEDTVENVIQNSFHELKGKKVEVKRAVPKEYNNTNDNGYNSSNGNGRVPVPIYNSYYQGNYPPAPTPARYGYFSSYPPYPIDYGYGNGWYPYGGYGYGFAPVPMNGDGAYMWPSVYPMGATYANGGGVGVGGYYNAGFRPAMAGKWYNQIGGDGYTSADVKVVSRDGASTET